MAMTNFGSKDHDVYVWGRCVKKKKQLEIHVRHQGIGELGRDWQRGMAVESSSEHWEI